MLGSCCVGVKNERARVECDTGMDVWGEMRSARVRGTEGNNTKVALAQEMRPHSMGRAAQAGNHPRLICEFPSDELHPGVTRVDGAALTCRMCAPPLSVEFRATLRYCKEMKDHMWKSPIKLYFSCHKVKSFISPLFF